MTTKTWRAYNRFGELAATVEIAAEYSSKDQALIEFEKMMREDRGWDGENWEYLKNDIRDPLVRKWWGWPSYGYTVQGVERWSVVQEYTIPDDPHDNDQSVEYRLRVHPSCRRCQCRTKAEAEACSTFPEGVGVALRVGRTVIDPR